MIESMNSSLKEDLKNIINNANSLKKDGKTHDYIAKYVHIELGKHLIFDNNYSVNFIKDGQIDKREETDISKKRKQKAFESINTDNYAQICRGMAEIYSAILTEIGIENKVVSVLAKEDAEGEFINENPVKVVEEYNCSFDHNLNIKNKNLIYESKEQPRHWYCSVVTEKGKYIQDYLTEKALPRIKIGETKIDSNIIAGFHKNEDHRDIVLKNKIDINEEFKNELLKEYKEFCTEHTEKDKVFQFIFQKLKQNNKDFGFEEAKDYAVILMRILPREDYLQKPEFINFVKEDINKCQFISIYNYNEESYLLKGGIDSPININIGKININQFNNIRDNGFEPRSEVDNKKLLKMKLRYFTKNYPKLMKTDRSGYDFEKYVKDLVFDIVSDNNEKINYSNCLDKGGNVSDRMSNGALDFKIGTEMNAIFLDKICNKNVSHNDEKKAFIKTLLTVFHETRHVHQFYNVKFRPLFNSETKRITIEKAINDVFPGFQLYNYENSVTEADAFKHSLFCTYNLVKKCHCDISKEDIYNAFIENLKKSDKNFDYNILGNNFDSLIKGFNYIITNPKKVHLKKVLLDLDNETRDRFEKQYKKEFKKYDKELNTSKALDILMKIAIKENPKLYKNYPLLELIKNERKDKNTFKQSLALMVRKNSFLMNVPFIKNMVDKQLNLISEPRLPDGNTYFNVDKINSKKETFINNISNNGEFRNIYFSENLNSENNNIIKNLKEDKER